MKYQTHDIGVGQQEKYKKKKKQMKKSSTKLFIGTRKLTISLINE